MKKRTWITGMTLALFIGGGNQANAHEKIIQSNQEIAYGKLRQ
ncbi:MAG TPA: hypothetical protein VEY68_15290 [Anoxybacillus sp.]|nr:hypothetical protein [Anoxybacillus sp.]